MKKKSRICVFDTETIPDVAALRAVYGYNGDDKDVMLAAFENQKLKTGSEFLPINFHKVVAISAVMADEFGKFERVNSIKASNEAELISKFIAFINAQNPRLVSFNGRGFDMPMLMIRAMKYNLSCPAYFETNDNGKDKWTNYRSRYDGIFHLDLCDHLGDFGAARGLNLDATCKSLNIPGKYDTHGDDVYRLFLDGELEQIQEYCESDTLNTYWLFLKYELLRGLINLDDYCDYLLEMSKWLENSKEELSYTPVFVEAIELEMQRIKQGVKPDKNHSVQSFEPELKPMDKDEAKQKLAQLGVSMGAGNLKTKEKTQTTAQEEALPEIDIDNL